MRRFEWPDEEGIEFHLPHGELIRVLGEAGFAVEALHELQAPEGAATRYDFVTPSGRGAGRARRSGGRA